MSPPLMCEVPLDCPNGPYEHEFIPDNEVTLPCCRQSWEPWPPQWGPQPLQDAKQGQDHDDQDHG
jgi:hypothetical protein